jgi:hypothetical protein
MPSRARTFAFPVSSLPLVVLTPLVALTAWTLPASASAPARPHIYLAEARTDTIEATPVEIFPAAEKALEDDHWVMSKESDQVRIVTDWKEFRHPLAKLVMGNLRARCVVDIQALDERRTVVRFRAGMASEKDIESNPALSIALSTYRGAVKDFYRDLATGIAERRLANRGTR